jgi:hypothetical protein
LTARRGPSPISASSGAQNSDPLRALAQERGRLLAELGVRPGDARWAQLEADALASLVEPAMGIRMPPAVERLWRRLGGWLR